MSDEAIPWLKLCRFFERVGNGKKGKAGGKNTKFPDKEKREFLSCTVLPPSRTLPPGGWRGCLAGVAVYVFDGVSRGALSRCCPQLWRSMLLVLPGRPGGTLSSDPCLLCAPPPRRPRSAYPRVCGLTNRCWLAGEGWPEGRAVRGASQEPRPRSRCVVNSQLSTLKRQP